MEETHQHLLQQLKMTVEGLLITQPTNVWHVYGGLNRLYSVLERVFKHGCRVFNQDGEPDCWIFIQGLSWLQPSLAASPTFIGELQNVSHSPSSRLKDKAKLWIYKSLESHSLSQKLAWLLTDREHLLSCFKPTAYLCQEKYSVATLICLQAVEQNQLSLLTDIDPSLYLLKWNVGKSHRRCASFPDGIRMTREGRGGRKSPSSKKEGTELTSISPPPVESVSASAVDTTESSLNEDICPDKTVAEQEKPKVEQKHESLLMRYKLWHSAPCLSEFGRPSVEVNGATSSSLEKPVRTVVQESKTEPSSPAISSSRSKRTAESKAPVPLSSSQSSEKLRYLSALKIDYKGLQQNDVAVNSRNNSKVKSNKMTKAAARDVIVMKDVPKSEPVPIKSNIKPRIPLLVSTSCSSSSLGNSELSVVAKKLIDPGKQLARKKKKDYPKLFNVPNSIWEETDDHGSEPKSKCVPNSKMKRQRSLDFVQSAPEQRQQWHLGRKKSFIEDGGTSVQPMSTRFFPRPTQGQSLASFLSSSQFTRANAELDRENAHFSISEAIISAIEQVKCNRWLGLVEETVEESDEEINSLKQRIRLRRKQKQEERRNTVLGIALLSDGKTDTTTTDQSASPFSSSPDASSDCLSSDGVDDLELDEVTSSNLELISKLGLSVSMASLYSEAEISRQSVPSEVLVSAEGVALSLLSKFSDKQLPRASDIEWLVSEQEVPQQLLPFPKSWPVSPDEAEDQDMRQATLLRGTTDWAPPRPQIIFTLHPTPVRRILMAKQNYRCSGCGVKVAMDYAHKYRYCEYLGRFFCTGCHTNQQAIIPGRVLTKWDFTKCPVSNFSFRLLDQMLCDPLFNITDHSPNLYRRARCLEKIRFLRLQLYYLKDFLLTCRFAHSLAETLKSEPPYMLKEPEVYSLQDLIDAKSGELGERLKELVSNGTTHVQSCQLCQVRGFVCEVCRSQEVIYAWELEKIVRCTKCGAGFHSNCYSTKLDCPRCKRISKRQNDATSTM